MKSRALPDDIVSPFKIKPKVAIFLGFTLLFLFLLLDYIAPVKYRLATLYIFPAVIIALNARSLKVVFLAIGLAVLFENFTTLAQHNFVISLSDTDADAYVVNFLIRLCATAIVIWLARALRRSQLRVNLLANSDTLTGLWNRRWARIMLDQQIAKLSVAHQPLTVALIDLNDFKAINDSRGHVVGDEVLVKASRLFQDLATPLTTFFRLGGDEFLVIMEGFDESSAEIFLDRLNKTVDASMQSDGFPVSLSIGSVTCYTPPNSSSELLHEADLRMYERKTSIKASRGS